MRFLKARPDFAGRFVVRNVGDSDLLLRIEPWADEFDVPPTASRTIFFRGPNEAEVEIEVEPTTITIWGWTGSTLSAEAEDV
jgi:hypothetical protein